MIEIALILVQPYYFGYKIDLLSYIVLDDIEGDVL